MVCASEHDVDETMALRRRIETPKPLLVRSQVSKGSCDVLSPEDLVVPTMSNHADALPRVTSSFQGGAPP